MADEFNERGLRIDTRWELFQASGRKCYFCWLGWTKYEKGHLHPQNLGWVECDDHTEGVA